MLLLSTFAIVGCRRRLAVAEAPTPQPSSNKFETVFGSNGALLGLGIAQARERLGSALDFRYRWLPPKIGCRRSPYASTVLEQVRDGIRLKRGFAWSRHSSSKGAAWLCSRLSLSLAAAEDWLSPKPLRLNRPRTSSRRYSAQTGLCLVSA